MADAQPGSSQTSSSEPIPRTVDIRIVCPTAGIPPLDFPSLSLDTTVRQLRDRILEELPHPAYVGHRLIHRGALLSNDELPLTRIISENQIRSGDRQTIHLIVTEAAPTGSSPAVPTHQRPALESPQDASLAAPPQRAALDDRRPVHLGRPAGTRDVPWAVHSRADAAAQQRIPRSEAERAIARTGPRSHKGEDNNAATADYVVYVQSAHGIVGETTAAQNTTPSAQAPTSETGLHGQGARDYESTGYGAVVDAPIGEQPQSQMYILSSPAGPRGLLVHDNAGNYFAPVAVRQRPTARQPMTRSTIHPWQFQTLPSRAPPRHREQQPQQAQPPAQPQVRQGRGRQPPHQHPVRLQVHPNNPGVAPLIAIWPHIWLLTRLALFVWWFSNNDPTWSRWLTLTAIAGVVFLFNTGMLNGFANEAWGPFRNHLEGLIPLADPNRPQPQAAPPVPPVAAARDAARVPDGTADPNPGQMAARLVAERRAADGNWLLDQVRRLERAGLLFLASIAPGVAEGHIAHLEAQERAARQQREAEEAAAIAAEAAEQYREGQEPDGGEQAPVDIPAPAEPEPLLVGDT